MAKRFVIYPGEVRSQSDGQRHFVSGGELIRHYGLDPRECDIVHDHAASLSPRTAGGREPDPALLPLYPLPSGDYKDFLLRRKASDFQDYVRACKLFEFHNSGASPKPKAVQKMFAEKNAKSMAWHEKHWPDFKATYERYNAK